MSLNKVLLIGNVGKDPEVRYTGGNGAADASAKVATITLATSDRTRDRVTGETREITEWHTIIAWRQLADLAEKFIRKGTQIYVEGRIRTRNWTDQTGNKRYSTEIIADSIQLLGRRTDNAAPAQPQYGAPQPAYAPQPSYAAQPYQAPAAPAPAPAPAAPAQQPISIDLDGPSDDLPF